MKNIIIGSLVPVSDATTLTGENMKKVALIITLATLLNPIIFADEMPPEVKRITVLRDKKVEEIDQKYWAELDKLKKKYSRSGNTKDALYIEKMQIAYFDKMKAKESRENASPSESQANSGNYADIYIKGVTKVRIKDEYALFENGYKKWSTVPESVKDKKMTCSKADGGWTGEQLTFEVKSAGDVVIIVDSQQAKRFDDWSQMDSGKYIDSNGGSERTAVVLKKHFATGEHALPLGAKWFPFIVVFM